MRWSYSVLHQCRFFETQCTFAFTAIIYDTGVSRCDKHPSSDIARYRKIWLHSQNWKYVTYCNDSRGGPSHSHRQHARKIWWSLDVWFSSYANGQTYTSQYFAPLLGMKYKLYVCARVEVYSGFAACEYVIVASNICFHLTCAVFDLRLFSFAVLRASWSSDRGYLSGFLILGHTVQCSVQY